MWCWKRSAAPSINGLADVSWTEVIRAITPDHAVLINRQNRRGSMIEAGMSMFILETEPAGYVLIAANEAEKASNITLVDVKAVGPSGVSPWRDGKVMWRKRRRRRCAPLTMSTAIHDFADRSDHAFSSVEFSSVPTVDVNRSKSSGGFYRDCRV